MKPGRWWRAQNACVDNAKLIKLSDRAHRNWFNLNCVANEHGGVLPDIETVAIKLRVSKPKAAAAIAEMVTAKLFDQREDGTFVPHDWQQWQYRTDEADPTNAQRQKRHRDKRRAERKAIEALLEQSNTALRNAVIPGTAKRPEAEADITTTVRVERGPSRGSIPSGLGEIIKQKGWA